MNANVTMDNAARKKLDELVAIAPTLGPVIAEGLKSIGALAMLKTMLEVVKERAKEDPQDLAEFEIYEIGD